MACSVSITNGTYLGYQMSTCLRRLSIFARSSSGRDAISPVVVGNLKRIELIRLAGIRKSVVGIVEAHQSAWLIIIPDIVAGLQRARNAEQLAEQYLEDVGVEHCRLPVTGGDPNLRVVEVGIGHVTIGHIGPIVVAVAHAPVGEGVGSQQRAETSRSEGVGARPGSGVTLGRRVDKPAAISVGRTCDSCFRGAEKEQKDDDPDYHT